MQRYNIYLILQTFWPFFFKKNAFFCPNYANTLIFSGSESVFCCDGRATFEALHRTEVDTHLDFGAHSDARTYVPPQLRLGNEDKFGRCRYIERIGVHVEIVGIAFVPKIGKARKRKTIFPPIHRPNGRNLERSRLLAHDVFVQRFNIVHARVVFAMKKIVEADQKSVVDGQTIAVGHKQAAIVFDLCADRHFFRQRETARHLHVGQTGIVVGAVCQRGFRFEIEIEIDKNERIADFVGFEHFERCGYIIAPFAKIVMYLKILRFKKKWRQAKNEKKCFFRKYGHFRKMIHGLKNDETTSDYKLLFN